MDEIEAAEHLYYYLHNDSKLIEKINSIDNSHLKELEYDYCMLDDLLLIIYNKNTKHIILPFRMPNNTFNFILASGKLPIIFTQHLISRFKKRALKDNSFPNMRNNIDDIMGNAICAITLILEKAFIILGCGLNPKYNDSYFLWSEYGIIPLEQTNNVVINKATTFLPVEKLKDNQKEVWEALYTIYLNQDSIDDDIFFKL